MRNFHAWLTGYTRDNGQPNEGMARDLYRESTKNVAELLSTCSRDESGKLVKLTVEEYLEYAKEDIQRHYR